MNTVYHDSQAKKRCNQCGQEKFLHQMVQRPGRYKDGVQPLCKECQNAKHMAWKAMRNPVKPFPKNLYQPMLLYKICTECGIEQELDQFNDEPAGLLGLRANCKSCMAKYRSTYRQGNLDTIRERDREYSSKRYHAEGEEGEAYRQMVRNARDRWNKNNKDRRNEHTQRRRASIAGTTVEPVDVLEVIARDGITCCICSQPIDLELPGTDPAGFTLEHDIPLSRGGTHTFSNVHPAHMLCNSRKLSKTLSELTPYDRRGLHT